MTLRAVKGMNDILPEQIGRWHELEGVLRGRLELGGYREIRTPIFEDYELIRRLERSSKTAYIRDVEIEVSARRFAEAPLRTLLVWSTIHSLYWLGVPAEKLAHLYHDLRAEDAPGARPKASL